MRATLISLVAILLLPVAAAAQPQQGMPDPREMSGVPRVQQGDPAGQLTVRLIQGSIVMNAPVGTAVHLVGIAADGKTTLQSGKIDDNGHTVFSGLRTGGNTAYYVSALLSRGTVQDRLVSGAITMPPKVGVRVLLAGLKPEVTDPAVDDLAEPGMPVLPAGEVFVSARGQVGQVREIRLVPVGAPERAMTTTAEVQDGLLAGRFTGVPGGPDRVYVAEVVAGGHLYRSTPIMLTDLVGAMTSIYVWPTALFGFHGGTELQDEKIWFQVQFAVANTSGAPYDPGPDGLLIPLPRGFGGARVGDEDTVRVGVDSDGFVWRVPLPPGQRDFVGTFYLPVEDGVLNVDWPLPLGAVDGQIVFGKVSGMTIETPTRAKLEERGGAQHQGQSFMVLHDIQRAAGERLTFTVRGLPHPPLWKKHASRIAGIMVVLMMVGATWLLLARGAPPTERVVNEQRRQKLMIERDTLYDRYVHLEKRHRGGQLNADAYDKARDKLMRQLEDNYRQLDEASGRS